MPISDSDPFRPDEVFDRHRVETSRALASIEARLRAEDPRLASRMLAWPVTPGTGSLSHRCLIRLSWAWILLVVILLVAAVALHNPPLAGAGLALLMVLPAVIVVAGRRMGLRRPRSTTAQNVH